MNEIIIKNESGSRQVVATQNSEGSTWSARLYVNKGETATSTAGKFKTEAGLREWAAKVMA
jgi:hypothetical protein